MNLPSGAITQIEESEIENYVNENLSSLLIKSKDKNYYYDQITKLKFLNHPEILSVAHELNFLSFHRFISKNPEISSIDDFCNYGLINYGFKDALSEQDHSQLLFLKTKYQLDETEYDILLKSTGFVLIMHEFVTFYEAPLITKLQNALSFIKVVILTSKKLKLKTDDDLSNKKLFSFDLRLIYKYRSLINLASDLIKRPNHKNSNTSLNYLCFSINDIAKKKSISNNLIDFTIPLLRDLKNIFPEQLNPIIKFDQSYLLKKITEGKKLKAMDDIERDRITAIQLESIT